MTANAAGRYATALFELAKSEGVADAVEADLAALRVMLDESAELAEVLTSPLHSAEVKVGVLAALAKKAKFNAMTANAFGVTARNGRAGELGSVARVYAALAAADRGVVTADVQTAAALTKKQTEALAASLKSAFGREIEVRTDVRPELMGGLIVKVGSRMFDSSLRTKLDGMKTAMKEA
ncbi:ATP synthase subunit delta [Maricaulis sp. W15]|uniref:F0F1 ATP synthase subunit delta n=1 Tax=Maricaulis sp. W15 TaxID=1772333 RepID=UPI0009488FDD|nr:F0F1 ATP synthase subunit delta [Maricaulis sp. W15]OLF75543.1 ATP synthase subunit delta [Maricaulis sp. W15]